MGVVVQTRTEWINADKSQVWNWALHYAMARGQSQHMAKKFLEREVPPQFWYQVQTAAKEYYK